MENEIDLKLVSFSKLGTNFTSYKDANNARSAVFFVMFCVIFSDSVHYVQ